MASVAMLSPAKKEPDILARTSILPKRKPIVSNVITRSRFVKPRPNVSVNKVSKEPLSAPQENVKADDDAPSQPIETEYEPLQRPTIPKRAVAIPAPPRARFQRAKPNIGSLMNKSAKDSQPSEEKPTSNDLTIEISDSKKDVTDDCKIESTSDKRSNSDSVLPRIRSSLNMEKVVDMALSIVESRLSPQPIVDLDSICGNYQELSSVSTTVPENKPFESHTEKKPQSDMLVKESENEISSSRDIEQSLISPRANFEIPPEKESPTAPAVLNKATEYPSLKSILNSPRKRTAPKKVHERRKRVANFSSTPSRSEMTMVDLIYWNPSSSPMKEIKPSAPAVEDLLPVDDPPPTTEETENCNIGPKVIINDDGEIILDESSLFVRRKDTVDHSVAAVVENENTTYSSFRNRVFKTWSKRETAKFYKALSLVGTDFALMENIFKEDGKVTRTRRELKLKFKREEKSNPKFVHTAIYELQTYDLNILDDDQDIELLNESELIDDAPKQAKRSFIQGIKTPGKRGRKKKTELPEATMDENTLDSIFEMEDESGSCSMSNGKLPANKNSSKFNSKIGASRPERKRKTKVLTDYITDVDGLSDTNDNLDSEEETLPVKKRKTAQILSEEEDSCSEVKDSNDLVPETSRSGRKIKAKKMPDFITDPEALNDSDDNMTSIEKVQNLQEVNIISCEENADNMTSLERMQDLQEVSVISCKEIGENLNALGTAQLEEFSIIPPTEADDPGEQNIIYTLDVENPSENNLAIEAPHVIDLKELNNPELTCVAENISPTEALPTAISTAQLKNDNFRKLPDSEVCNNVDANNILTDPGVTEVVVTSDQTLRRTKRKILPNVIKGSKRPPIQKKPMLPPRRTSFTSFTPVEEERPKQQPKSSFVQPVKTYLKHSKQIKSEESDDMPEYLETIQNSPVSISRKRSLSGPSKSPCTPDMNISRTNSMCTPTRSPLTNAPLNVFSFNSESTPTMHQSSVELPLNASTADPKTININPENLSDSPPVVLFTRTPNNSNMLHLFVYQKS